MIRTSSPQTGHVDFSIPEPPRRRSPWEGDVHVLPTTVAQRAFWYLDQVDPGNPVYNIAVRFRLQGPLDVPLLGHCIDEITRRHETLRTIIREIDGGRSRVVAPELQLPLAAHDLDGLSPSERDTRAEGLTLEVARAPFDLGTGPLARFVLLRLGAEEHTLLLTIHHIIADGWSIGIIASELGDLYRAQQRGEPSPLAPLPLQYGDFAIWQEKWLAHETFRDGLAYWTRMLAGSPRAELPTDHPRPDHPAHGGHIESILLPRALTDTLENLAREEGATLFTVGLTALFLVIRERTGRDDLVVGSLVAGRTRSEVEPLIGLFINAVALRCDTSGDPTLRQLLARVREIVAGALTHGEVPFDRVVEAVQPRRRLHQHPLFQVNFISQRDFVRPFVAGPLTLTALPSRSPGAIHDLNVFLVERAEGWRASIEFDTELYESSTILNLLGELRRFLEALATDPDRHLSALHAEEREPDPEPPLDRPIARVVDATSPEPSAAIVAPPIEDTESRLRDLWEVLLGHPVSLEDDFFDVGGHSLLAMRLLARVEREFGARIPLAVFLQSPNMAAMLGWLKGRAEESRARQSIVLQPSGTGTPFVLVDSGPYFRPLARHLGHGQPVLGLILPLTSELPDGFTASDLAANLVRALQVAQPRGPYRLGGWCNAGVIAFEMARQLREQGETVSLLVLLDSNDPRYLRRFRGLRGAPFRLYFMLEKVWHHLRAMTRLGARGALAYARERLQSYRELWSRRYWRLMVRELRRAPGEHLRSRSLIQYLCVEDYDPQPCPTPIVLFRSTFLQEGPFRDPALGWGDVAVGGLTVHAMPGNHRAMFEEPLVADLAAKLREHLERDSTSNPGSV